MFKFNYVIYFIVAHLKRNFGWLPIKVMKFQNQEPQFSLNLIGFLWFTLIAIDYNLVYSLYKVSFH